MIDGTNLAKPMLAAAQLAPVRPQQPVSAAAVRTDLAREVSVQQLERAAAVQLELSPDRRRQELLAAMARSMRDRLRRAPGEEREPDPPAALPASRALPAVTAYAQAARRSQGGDDEPPVTRDL